MKNKSGQGRKPGTTKDRAHLNTTISRANKEWLDKQKRDGKTIAKILDLLIEKEKNEIT